MSFDLKQFAEGWLNYTRAVVSPGTLSEDVKKKAKDRSDICKTCPEFQNFAPNHPHRPITGRCQKCGCAFPAMVYSIGKDCPLNKW